METKQEMIGRLGSFCTWVAAIASLAVVSLHARAETELSSAAIVSLDGAYATCADMLADEIERRSSVRLDIVESLPDSQAALILPGTGQQLAAIGLTPPGVLEVPDKAEGYAIWVDTGGAAARVCLAGHDRRGVLFAAGRLIRLIHFDKKRITLDDGLKLATAPRFAIRGHQVGYRNTPNSYDAWDLATYEQYIRDQVIFGGNSVEFTPSLDPSEKRGPHMTKTAWEMTADLIKLLDAYDLDSWIWQEIPTEADVSVPAVADEQLAQWWSLLEHFGGLDDVFVPGGDGGITPAPVLMPFLARLAPVVQEIRPGAGLWVSNQTFEFAENDYFFDFLQKEQPSWLTGVVYGPWTKLGIIEMREKTPQRYGMRLYADITHTVRCQYPVPDWDRAFAHGLNREAPNPRPRDMYHIFTRYAAYAGDSITYSEGVNDDLNKFVWTALGWDPDTPLDAILHDYGKVFFGDAEAGAVAKGLLMLEQNWRGPIAANAGIAGTLAHWKGIAERCPDALDTNWRLQMYLMRAYYDAYLQEKARQEALYEAEAHEALENVRRDGVDAALDKARAALAKIEANPPMPEYRKEIEALAARLFKTIGMQLSVHAPYLARGPERGAILDTLDFPLNNRRWLEKEFDEIASLTDPETQLARIDMVINWEDAGPGGFYDDLGNPEKQPHLVRQRTWEDDPGYVDSPQCEYAFGIDQATLEVSDARLSWLDQSTTLYKCPLRMRYEGLDKNARYRLRITYAGRYRPIMRLTADGRFAVHDWLPQPAECRPLEFDVPQEATQDGVLDLEWQANPDNPDAWRHRPLNRGCQVAEVWLIRQ